MNVRSTGAPRGRAVAGTTFFFGAEDDAVAERRQAARERSAPGRTGTARSGFGGRAPRFPGAATSGAGDAPRAAAVPAAAPRSRVRPSAGAAAPVRSRSTERLAALERPASKPSSSVSRVRSKGKARHSDVLNAAALQSHFSRLLAMPSSRPLPPLGGATPAARTATDGRPSDMTVLDGVAGEEDYRPAVVRPQRGAKPIPRSAERAIVEATRADVALRPKRLTLAQRLGLMPAPEEPLTAEQWASIHTASKDRQDSSGECAICREEFGNDDQVLLSCSHVFHRQCIASFERYAKVRACPLCRKAEYRKRLIQDGRDAYYIKSIVRVQAQWRMYIARKEYRHVLETYVPTDPIRRRAFFAKKLGKASQQMDMHRAKQDDDIDALFAELDANVAKSRAVMAANMPLLAAEDRRMRADAAEAQQTTSSGVPVTDAQVDAAVAALAGAALGASRGHVHTETRPGGPTWADVERRALARGDGDCSICRSKFKKVPGERALLSCSHVFHHQCMSAFESYAVDEILQCPLCRTPYTRITM